MTEMWMAVVSAVSVRAVMGVAASAAGKSVCIRVCNSARICSGSWIVDGAGNVGQQLRAAFDQRGHLAHIGQELAVDEVADFGQGAARADDGVREGLIVGAAFRVMGQAVGVGAGAFQGGEGFDEVGVGRENVCFEHLAG